MPSQRLLPILVVEDNEPERRVLCDILQEEGFTAIGCGSATEGLQKCRQGRFEVAVVDLRLPDFSGTQLLGRLLGLDEEMRVIIYTGAASYDSIKDALNLGAFAYVEKLTDPSELLRHVHRACRERVDRYARRLEAAVAQRTEELARSNRELEEFASVVAHDLRSPLLTISGYCQVLQAECAERLGSETQEYCDHILKATAHMNRLIEDLLDYSRAARSTEPFAPVDLGEVLVLARANLQAAIEENRARLDVPPLPQVHGNQTQLVQLFQNLIGNAIKFRRDVDPVVRLAVQRTDHGWQLSVQDNGVGIAAEHFDRVFQVFQRFHGESYPGTGIGLAICKKIVERHGGNIWLESTVGQGTAFRFTLPAVP